MIIRKIRDVKCEFYPKEFLYELTDGVLDLLEFTKISPETELEEVFY